MPILRNYRMQSVIQPPTRRSLPHVLRPPLTKQPLLVRPPLPVRREQMTVTELRIYQMLRLMFVLIPLVAGADKFFYSITDWDRYVPTLLTSMHIDAHTLMIFAGSIEIVVALLIAIKPRIGALAMIGMLAGIMLDLLAIPRQLHIILLDCCLCVSSLCLFLLASKHEMLRRMD
jgi:hypothetical protein